MVKHTLPKSFLRAILLLILLAALTACGGSEEEAAGRIVGEIVFINGAVNVRAAGTNEVSQALIQQKLVVGDRLAVEDNSLLRFDLDVGTQLYAMPLTVFNIDDLTPNDDEAEPAIDLEIGQLWVLQPKGSILITTPLGDVTAKQAHMRISYAADHSKGLEIDCLSGTCEFATLVDSYTIEAGEQIRLNTTNSPETVYQVQEEVVEEWLSIYPLATMLLPQLSETPTPPVPQTPIVTINGTECPLPDGWQAVLVGEGQSLEGIAEAYTIDLETLREANCMSSDDVLAVGAVIYVPVIRQSLTPTQTPTDTPTITLTPTITPTQTRTITPTIPSATPAADQNTVFDIQQAPFTSISTCEQTFRVYAADPETISSIKVLVSINSDTFTGGQVFDLPHIGNNIYQDTLIIDTSATGADLVYWRIMSTDMQNNVQLYPKPPQYHYYSDTLNCAQPTKTRTNTPVVTSSPTPTPSRTPTGTIEATEIPDETTNTATPTQTSTNQDLTNAVFSNPIGPKGIAIVNCLNTFSVEVTDPDGIGHVSIQYTVNDETFSTYNTIELEHQGANLYGDILRLDTSLPSGTDVVYWRFELEDAIGNLEYYPETPYSYTDSLDCTGS